MSDRISRSTIQATDAMQGNYSAGQAVPSGYGVGIYVGVTGDVEITTIRGQTVVYTSVPQGTFMQVPLFSAIGSNTTSTDLTVSYITTPWL